MQPVDLINHSGVKSRVLYPGGGGGVGRCGTTHFRIVLRTESRFRYLMFSRMVERKPSSSCQCCSSHLTTTSLLSHR